MWMVQSSSYVDKLFMITTETHFCCYIVSFEVPPRFHPHAKSALRTRSYSLSIVSQDKLSILTPSHLDRWAKSSDASPLPMYRSVSIRAENATVNQCCGLGNIAARLSRDWDRVTATVATPLLRNSRAATSHATDVYWRWQRRIFNRQLVTSCRF